MKLHDIDKAMYQTEVRQRKGYLIQELRRLGTYQMPDGRRLEDARLPELEWLNIEVQNEVARAYGEKEQG